MSVDEPTNVSVLLICSLRKRSEGTEAMGTGDRRTQWVMKESRIMLKICFVPLSLRSSRPGISQVGPSPGSLILSVGSLLAMLVRRVSV